MINELTEQEQIDVDLDYFDMERKWRSHIPKHTIYGWLTIFPEAITHWKPILLRQMKIELMFAKARLDDIRYDTLMAIRDNKYDWRYDLISDYGRRQIAEVKRKINEFQWQIKLIQGMQSKPVDGIQAPAQKNITPEMVYQAKKFPIEQLIEVNRQWFAKCLWHNDTNASMFCKKNFAHCFSCGKNGDTIAVLMKKEGLSFRDAVLRLQ